MGLQPAAGRSFIPSLEEKGAEQGQVPQAEKQAGGITTPPHFPAVYCGQLKKRKADCKPCWQVTSPAPPSQEIAEALYLAQLEPRSDPAQAAP